MKETETKWYQADVKKFSRTAHLAGHWRLGDDYSKCGKVLAADVTRQTMRGAFEVCKNCTNELYKEQARAAINAKVKA